jgi:hypothetical protein
VTARVGAPRSSDSIALSVLFHPSSLLFFQLVLTFRVSLSVPRSIYFIVTMFKFPKKRPDFVYEKVSRSSSENGSSSEEAQGFLTPDLRELVPQKSRKLRILAIVSLVFSGLLNISLLSFVGYRYAHRGPSSPVFPELVYCKFKSYLSLLVYLRILHRKARH